MKEELTVPICITMMVLALIACVSYYNISDRKLMSQNIDSAIVLTHYQFVVLMQVNVM
jgi:hypothetical protein